MVNGTGKHCSGRLLPTWQRCVVELEGQWGLIRKGLHSYLFFICSCMMPLFFLAVFCMPSNSINENSCYISFAQNDQGDTIFMYRIQQRIFVLQVIMSLLIRFCAWKFNSRGKIEYTRGLSICRYKTLLLIFFLSFFFFFERLHGIIVNWMLLTAITLTQALKNVLSCMYLYAHFQLL